MPHSSKPARDGTSLHPRAPLHSNSARPNKPSKLSSWPTSGESRIGGRMPEPTWSRIGSRSRQSAQPRRGGSSNSMNCGRPDNSVVLPIHQARGPSRRKGLYSFPKVMWGTRCLSNRSNPSFPSCFTLHRPSSIHRQTPLTSTPRNRSGNWPSLASALLKCLTTPW